MTHFMWFVSKSSKRLFFFVCLCAHYLGIKTFNTSTENDKKKINKLQMKFYLNDKKQIHKDAHIFKANNSNSLPSIHVYFAWVEIKC